jgi:hypothetical protein
MRELPPLPKHLLGRPRDDRGYPIPHTVMIRPDGKPDFRIIDQEKAGAAGKARRCTLCGQPMGRFVAFVGGPLCHQYRHFADGPMHRDCALFAVQTCPHIVLPKAQYREGDKVAGAGMTLQPIEWVDPDKPDLFMVATTTRYEIKVDQGHLLYAAAPWESVTWWREGREVAGG